jgi:hypothetical protein
MAGQQHIGSTDAKLEAAVNGTGVDAPNGTPANGSTQLKGNSARAIEPVAVRSPGPVATANGSGRTAEAGDGEHHGMVLPFSSVTLTFRDVHYYVPTQVSMLGRRLEASCCETTAERCASRHTLLLPAYAPCVMRVLCADTSCHAAGGA